MSPSPSSEPHLSDPFSNSLDREDPATEPHSPHQDAKEKNSTASNLTASEEVTSLASAEERGVLQSALDEVLLQLLLQGSEVYLDGLGIVSPVVVKKLVRHPIPHSPEILFQKRECISLAFEKCIDISLLPNRDKRFIVDHGRLTERVYASLPLELHIKWTEAKTRRALRGIFRHIRHELIVDGVSNRLPSLGPLYAFHNKTGAPSPLWYDEAEILLDPQLFQARRILSSKIAPDLEFQDSWEAFRYAFGMDKKEFSIDLRESLRSLGYECDPQLAPALIPDEIRVAVFDMNSNSRERELLYVSNGLRHTTGEEHEREHGKEHGQEHRKEHCGDAIELSFALRIDKRRLANYYGHLDAADGLDTHIPEWPLNLFTLAWVLLQGSPRKTLRAGAGINLESNLCPWPCAGLGAMLVTESSHLPGRQKAEQSTYRLMHLLGIPQDEAQLAESFGPHYLLTLLRLQKKNILTDPLRAPIPAPAMRISSI